MGPISKWIFSICLLVCSSTASAQGNVPGSQAPELAGHQQNPGIVSNSGLFFVNPNVLNLLLGDKQRLQLLDTNGAVVSDVIWTAVDPSVAETLPGEDAVSTLVTAKAVGQTKIVATSGGYSAYAELTVFPGGSRPNGILRWAAPALPGSRQDLSSIVQSLRMDDKTPDLYVGDGSRIRAFDQDGQQRWVWPVSRMPGTVRLLAGDDRGGAVALVSDRSDDSIICLDSAGHQVWAHQLGPKFKLSDYAIDMTGLVYLLEDQPQGPSDVIALEPDTGRLRFTVAVPMSAKGGANWEKRNVAGRAIPVCVRGTKDVNLAPGPEKVPSEHGKLVVTSENNLYLPVLVQTVVFDGLPCEPASDLNHSQPLDTRVSTLRYSAALQAMQIQNDGTHSLIAIDSASYTGPDWNAPVLHFGANERAIPDGNGDDELLLPSIVTVGSLYRDAASTKGLPEGRIYRFNRTSNTHFSLPLLPSSPANSDGLLIGEHSKAFMMGTLKNTPAVAGFDFTEGTGGWLTPAPFPEGTIQLEMVMADDSLVFEYLHDGQTRLMMADPRGTVLPLLPYDLAAPTGSNGPSYWTLGTWFVFLHDQSIASVSRAPQ